MKKLALALCLPCALACRASDIWMFNDPGYIDSSSPGASAPSLQALLLSQGHRVIPFGGIAAGDFAAARASGIILFPSLRPNTSVAYDMSPEAKSELKSFVAEGGSLIAVGNSSIGILDGVLYGDPDHELASTGTAGPSALRPEIAAGTPFEAGPVTLDLPAATGVNRYAFAEPNSLPLYEDIFQGVTLLVSPFQKGHYAMLGWGYEGSVPNGNLDGGWAAALDLTVQTVPEPGSVALLALGAALLLSRKTARTARRD